MLLDYDRMGWLKIALLGFTLLRPEFVRQLQRINRPEVSDRSVNATEL